MRAAALLVAVFVLAAAPAATDDSLRQVLDRAAEYLERYRDTLSTVIAEERYEQQLSGPRVQRTDTLPTRRVLHSEYLLLPGEQRADGWAGFRDVISVDGRRVRDQSGRLEQLLKSSGVGARATALAQESARYNIGNVLRTINVPTLALEFLAAANRARITTRKTGEAKLDGVSAWIIEFDETFTPTIIRHPDGDSIRTRGTWWIEPAAGTVVRTELRTTAPVAARITVKYGRDARLDLWVPLEMVETYQTMGGHITGMARYSNYRQFTTGGRLITPKY